MPAPQAEYAATVLAYQQQQQRLRASLVGIIEQIWRALGSYRTGDVPRFVDQVLPVVTGGQRATLSLTVAYLAHLRVLALGGTPRPVVVDERQLSGGAVRGGVDHRDVYARPFNLVWRQLHDLPREPGAIDQAIEAGMTRAVELALDDLQLTKTQTAAAAISNDPQVAGYRRVLEGAHSCGLCIVASTQRYHKQQLLPIHGGCDCGVAPIYGALDPGHVIDPETLADVHQRVQARFGVTDVGGRALPGKGLPDYRDLLVTHQHGELGPVLGVRGQPFTGPDDIH